MLKFAIVKYVKSRDLGTIALEYNEDEVLKRLTQRTLAALGRPEEKRLMGLKRAMKSSWSEEEISKALKQAFSMVVDELKGQTISLA